MAERGEKRKTNSPERGDEAWGHKKKRAGPNTSCAKGTLREGGKAESPCREGQSFTAGLLINQQSGRIHTIDSAHAQIWCDICHAGFGAGPIFFLH